MVAHNTGSTVTCSVIKLAYYNLKLYELEIYDLIVAKVALKVYRYRYRHRGKSLFTYRLCATRNTRPARRGEYTGLGVLANELADAYPGVSTVSAL